MKLDAAALFLFVADSARISRKRKGEKGSKFIAGVPVLNYHIAYGPCSHGGAPEQDGAGVGGDGAAWHVGSANRSNVPGKQTWVQIGRPSQQGWRAIPAGARDGGGLGGSAQLSSRGGHFRGA